MFDAENHVAQQTSLRTHRLMDQCDVVPKVGKALHWRVAASMSSTIWITREGQQDLFFCHFRLLEKPPKSWHWFFMAKQCPVASLPGHTPQRTGAAALSHAGPGSLNSALGK